MADDIKRLNYFDGQFLREKDFSDEQEYHLQLQRDHARLFHNPGIASGLDIQDPPAGSSSVTVQAGVAYDDQGRRIVLADNKVMDLSGVLADQDAYVTITYNEIKLPEDKTDETGISDYTRVTEVALVEFSTTAPGNPNQKLVLARVTRSGTQVDTIDRSGRLQAGAKGGDLTANSLTLTSDSIASAGWAKIRLTGTLQTQLDASLKVNGTISGTLAANTVGTNQLVDASVTNLKLADGSVSLAKMATNSVGNTQLVDGSVSLAKMATNSVGTSQLIAGSVGTTQLAANSVGTTQLINAAVTLAKMATGSVGTSQLVNNSVGTTQLANNSVGATQLVAGSVGTAQLANNSVGTAQLIAGSVGTAQLANGSVGTTQLADGSVTAAKLAATITAAVIPVVDSGNNLNAANVETALAEVMDAFEGDHFRGNETSPGQHRTIHQPQLAQPTTKALLWDSLGVGNINARLRVYADTDLIWFTLNASWNGTAWAKDNIAPSGGFRFSRNEFTLLHENTSNSTFSSWSRTWLLPMSGTDNSAFELSGTVRETGRLGLEFSNGDISNTRTMWGGGSITFRNRFPASPSSITLTVLANHPNFVGLPNAGYTDRDGFGFYSSQSIPANQNAWWFGSYTAIA